MHLTHAYFIPDPQLLKALIDAAGRGVDVQLILPSHSDSELTFHAGRSHYATLLKAGVKIHERHGALLHSKTAVINGGNANPCYSVSRNGARVCCSVCCNAPPQ